MPLYRQSMQVPQQCSDVSIEKMKLSHSIAHPVHVDRKCFVSIDAFCSQQHGAVWLSRIHIVSIVRRCACCAERGTNALSTQFFPFSLDRS